MRHLVLFNIYYNGIIQGKHKIMSDLSGQTIDNYHLAEIIGKGGHGTVYKGWDIETRQTVAVKVMLAKHVEDQIMVHRLQQEAGIIRDLRHPNIVPLIESWEDENGVCLVMPWIDGEDLRGLLNRKNRLSPPELSSILTQICGALDATHAAQIIHRDIKPENILIDRFGKAYLTDFGFAKRKDDHSFSTTAGVIIGSTNYLSPEQISGETISNRTDIFAIGILIFEMLAGRHPFHESSTRMQVLMQLVNEDLPVLQSIGNLAQFRVERINDLIARCTDKSPDNRYLTASSVAYHFAQITQIDISPPNV